MQNKNRNLQKQQGLFTKLYTTRSFVDILTKLQKTLSHFMMRILRVFVVHKAAQLLIFETFHT